MRNRLDTQLDKLNNQLISMARFVKTPLRLQLRL